MEGIRICAVSSFGRFKSSQGVVTNPKPAKDGYVRVQINRKSNHAHPVHSQHSLILQFRAQLLQLLSFRLYQLLPSFIAGLHCLLVRGIIVHLTPRESTLLPSSVPGQLFTGRISCGED